MVLTKPGEKIEVKVPAEVGDLVTSVFGKVYDKLVAEGKEPFTFMPVGEPELVSE